MKVYAPEPVSPEKIAIVTEMLQSRAGMDEVEFGQTEHFYLAPLRSVVSAASFFFRRASSRVIIVPSEERMPERSFSR